MFPDYRTAVPTASEYTCGEQEFALRQKLDAEPYAVIVRGRHSIAAGAGLSHDLIVFASGAIASGILYDLFKHALSKVREALRDVMGSDVPLNRVVFKTRDCDYIVSSNCNAGIYSEAIDYNQLLSRMESFVKIEAENNRPVAKIEAPCDLRIAQHGWETLCCGVGNYSLWKVEYKDGDKWPEALYDTANKTFVELAGGEVPCLIEDEFYVGQTIHK